MSVQERLRRAASARTEELKVLVHDGAEEVLLALLDNPAISEEHLKVLLSRPGVTGKVLRGIASREALVRPYPIKLALVRHPRTPRSVSIPLLRYVYLFDLAKLVSTPQVAPEVRRLAEEAIVSRVNVISLGERLTLSRQGSARVAAALLGDPEPRVFQAALENPHLTQDGVVKALAGDSISAEAVEAIAVHPRWSLRYDVRLALLRHPCTSLARALMLMPLVRREDLALLTDDWRMPADRRRYIANLLRHGPRAKMARAAAGRG